MQARKRIALVAHDSRKPAMASWADRNKAVLGQHDLWATGTTGGLIAERTGLAVTRLMSGPQGGDQQLGAMIAEGKIDVLIFFTDPLAALPHDVDVKALLRVSTLHETVIACNRATSDFILQSPLLNQPYNADDNGAAGSTEAQQ